MNPGHPLPGVRRVVVTLAALALLAGCAARGPSRVAPETVRIPEEERGLSAEERQVLESVRQGLVERRKAVRALRGRGLLVLASPEYDGASRVEATVVADREGRMRLRGYAALTTVFDVLAGPERFWLYLPDRAEVWSGPAQGLGTLSGLPLVPSDLVSALFTEPFGQGDEVELVRYDHDAAHVRWQVDDSTRVEGRFRRDYGVPSELHLLRDGERVASLRYTDWLRESVGWWPREMSLVWPERNASLRLAFDRLELNPELPGEVFRFEPPEGAVWYELSAAPGSGAEGVARR